MKKGLFAESPPFTQFVIAVFTMLSCALLLMFVGILFAPVLFGISFADFIEITTKGEISRNLNLFRYLQSLQTIAIFIVPAFFSAYLFSGNSFGYFGFRNNVPVNRYCMAFLIIITISPFVNLLASFNETIVFPESLSWLEKKFRASEDAAAGITKLFLDVDSIGGMFFNIFMIAALAALGEELIFRGVLQHIFVRWTKSTHAGIIISAFLFSAMHMQFYGFFPRWLLGTVFGYMMVWSGSVWLPVFAHFVNNALAVIISYLTQKGHIPETLSEYGTTWNAAPVTVTMMLICILLLRRMYQVSKRKRPVSGGYA